MKKVLIAYFSLTGKTEMMAQYVAEGVRFSGNEAVVNRLGDSRQFNIRLDCCWQI